MGKRVLCALTTVAISFTSFTSAMAAETKVLVGLAAGGGYDFAARLMAPFLEKHLGNEETVVVQNVPGASSLNLARLMAVSDADDEIGLVLASQIVKARRDSETVAVDFSAFKWIGSLNTATSICITSKDSKADSFEKLITEDLKIGATSMTGGFYELAALIKNAYGAKYEIVTGFKGLTDIEAAMDRGEVDGYCGSQLDRYVRNNQQENRWLIGSLGTDVEFDGKTIPAFVTKASSDEDKAAIALYTTADKVYYPFFMAPGASDEAVERYRAAFAAVLTDREFQEKASSFYLSVNAMDGLTLSAEIKAVADASPATVERLKELLK